MTPALPFCRGADSGWRHVSSGDTHAGPADTHGAVAARLGHRHSSAPYTTVLLDLPWVLKKATLLSPTPQFFFFFFFYPPADGENKTLAHHTTGFLDLPCMAQRLLFCLLHYRILVLPCTPNVSVRAKRACGPSRVCVTPRDGSYPRSPPRLPSDKQG